MIQIRKNVFETNSSSTHSMVIPKEISSKKLKNIKHIDFHFGDYGRPTKTFRANPADYIYTAIYCRGKNWVDYDVHKQNTCPQKMLDLIEEDLSKLRAALDKYKITYTFETPIWADTGINWYDTEEEYTEKCLNNPNYTPWYSWINDPMGLDHAAEDEIGEFLDAVLNDPDMLIRYLLSGKVYVGSDETTNYEYCKIMRNEPTYVKYKCHTEYDYSDPRFYEEIVKPNKFYLGDSWKDKYDFFVKPN